MTEFRVEQPTWYQPVNVDSDGTPRCKHGDRMIEIAENQWQCPDAKTFFDYLRSAVVIEPSTLNFERLFDEDPNSVGIRATGTWRLRRA
jgi:hypothetical protein